MEEEKAGDDVFNVEAWALMGIALIVICALLIEQLVTYKASIVDLKLLHGVWLSFAFSWALLCGIGYFVRVYFILPWPHH